MSPISRGRRRGSVIIKPNRFSVEWKRHRLAIVAFELRVHNAHNASFIYNNSSILAKRNNWNFHRSKSSRHFSRIGIRVLRPFLVRRARRREWWPPRVAGNESSPLKFFQARIVSTLSKIPTERDREKVFSSAPSSLCRVVLGQNPFHGFFPFENFRSLARNRRKKRT